MNPIMNIFGGGNNMLLKAVGAAMRGESPEAFMSNLAKTTPALSGLDLSNLQGTAQKLCNDKGVDINTAVQTVTTEVNNLK